LHGSPAAALAVPRPAPEISPRRRRLGAAAQVDFRSLDQRAPRGALDAEEALPYFTGGINGVLAEQRRLDATSVFAQADMDRDGSLSLPEWYAAAATTTTAFPVVISIYRDDARFSRLPTSCARSGQVRRAIASPPRAAAAQTPRHLSRASAGWCCGTTGRRRI
jgi:hypothetical protein